MAKACVMVSCEGMRWCWGKICCSCLWCTSIKAAMSTSCLRLLSWQKTLYLLFRLGGILFCLFVLGLLGLLVLGSLVYRSCVFVFVVLCAMCCVC